MLLKIAFRNYYQTRTFDSCTGLVIYLPQALLKDDYSTYDDEDLLLILQFREDSPDDAQAAGEQLYRRFNERLLAACIKKLEFNGNDVNDAPDIVFNTWQRLFLKPEKYDQKKASRGISVKERVFRYIRGILQREYANWFNGRTIPQEEDYHIIYDLEDESKFTNERLKALRQLEFEGHVRLSGLSKAERAIFLTYLEYRPEGGKIPRGVREMLANEFGLYGDDSVITYFHRARRKVQEKMGNSNG